LRILVTESPKLIEPAAGAWPTLDAFLQGLLLDEARDQRPFLFGWLKVAVEALRQGHRRPGKPWFSPGLLTVASRYFRI